MSLALSPLYAAIQTSLTLGAGPSRARWGKTAAKQLQDNR